MSIWFIEKKWTVVVVLRFESESEFESEMSEKHI